MTIKIKHIGIASDGCRVEVEKSCKASFLKWFKYKLTGEL